MTGDVKAAVHDFWDREACGERYGSEQERKRYALEPEVLEFARFEAAAGKRVLEIGVGMGADFLRWLRSGALATGVDLTQHAVDITRERVKAEGFDARVEVADAEHLPFEEDSFDLVYSWGVLHHTPDTAAAIGEAVRVLCPGGDLKIMMYHRPSWVALAAWVRFCALRGRPFHGLRYAVSHVESPGTKAFTKEEAEALGSGLRSITATPKLTWRDRRFAPGLSRLIGDRLGFYLLIEGTK